MIQNEDEVRHYLKFIGYFRLSAYARPFQDLEKRALAGTGDKPFIPGTTFDQVLKLYVFDRELRLLVMDAIERIEVAVRTCIVNAMCAKYGPHWHMNKEHFYDAFRHDQLIKKIENEVGITGGRRRPEAKHHESFINHYYETYSDPCLPPAWIIAEVLPMGSWSRVFAGLKRGEDRKDIARKFGEDENILKGWWHVLSHVRNLCAHHSRLWNRRFVIKSELSRQHATFTSANDRFYAVFLILRDLMLVISPRTAWEQKLANLFQEHPGIKLESMGFPSGWTLVQTPC